MMIRRKLEPRPDWRERARQFGFTYAEIEGKGSLPADFRLSQEMDADRLARLLADSKDRRNTIFVGL